MKNYSIITSITSFALISILFFTCFTCTYFDPSAAAGVRPSLFWINSEGEIFRSPLSDPREFDQILYNPPVGIPTCIKIDPLGGFIYWGLDNMGTGSIHRINLDGNEEEMIIETGNYIKSIAIDNTEQIIYFTEGPVVKMVPLTEDKGPRIIFEHPSGYEIADIILDFSDNRIIITDYTMTYFWTDMYDPGMRQGNGTFLYNADKIVADNFNNYFFYSTISTTYDMIRENLPPDGNSLTLFSSGLIVDFAVDTKDEFVYCAEQYAVYKIPVNGGPAEMIIAPSLNLEIFQFTMDFIQ